MTDFKNLLKQNKFIYHLLLPLVNSYRYLFHFYFRNKKFRQNGTRVLLKAKMALDHINLHYWLDFGTLLGVYRDQKLLTNDLDLDIGVFLCDYCPEIEETMKKFGFRLIREYIIDDKKSGLQQTFLLDGVSIDLFYYISNGDKMHCHCFTNFRGYSFADSIKVKGGVQPIEQYLPNDGFRKIIFEGGYFNVPDDTHKYLAYHYGEDYMTPRKWDYCDLENDNINAILLNDKLGKVLNY